MGDNKKNPSAENNPDKDRQCHGYCWKCPPEPIGEAVKFSTGITGFRPASSFSVPQIHRDLPIHSPIFGAVGTAHK
jgi:hypothetical protein